MIRMMRLIVVTMLAFAYACSPVDEVLTPQVEVPEASTGEIEMVQYPLLVLDYESARSQLEECENKKGNYACLIIKDILEDALSGPVIIRPPRPRHCPVLSCDDLPVPSTGPVCEPDKCRSLFADRCFHELKDLQLSVKAVDPYYVRATLTHNGKIIGSTDAEGGGAVLPGLDCSSAILDFGVSIPEIALPGTLLNVQTKIAIGDDLVDTKFTFRL